LERGVYCTYFFSVFSRCLSTTHGEIKTAVKRTFLPASSCDDVRSSSSLCCCARSLSDSVRRSRSSSSCLVKFSSLVSFSRLSLSDASFSAASLQAKIHYTSFPVASPQQVRNIIDKSATSWPKIHYTRFGKLPTCFPSTGKRV